MNQIKWKICICNGHYAEECRTQNENFPKNKKTFNWKQHSKSHTSTLAQYAENKEDNFYYVFTIV